MNVPDKSEDRDEIFERIRLKIAHMSAEEIAELKQRAEKEGVIFDD